MATHLQAKWRVSDTCSLLKLRFPQWDSLPISEGMLRMQEKCKANGKHSDMATGENCLANH